MTAPSLLDGLNPIHWPTLVVVSSRVVGLFLVAPLWSMSSMPKVLRAALIVVFGVSLLPTVQDAVVPDAILALPIPIGTELLIGLAMGLVASVFVQGIAMAGEVASLQMGLNMGEALGLTDTPTSTGVGELKTMLVMALYVTLDGHVVLLRGLADSFHVIRPGGAIALTDGSRLLITIGGTIFETAIRAAAPIMVALLLTNFGLAILSRAVPQLNAMAIAFPITISVGLLVLGLSLPFFGRFVGEWTSTIGAHAAATVGALAPAGR